MSRHPKVPIKDIKIIPQKKQILAIFYPVDEEVGAIGVKLSHPLAMKLKYELQNGINTDI